MSLSLWFPFGICSFIVFKKNPNLPEAKGVPQGSPISAVLANVYMLKADKQIYEYVSALQGFYMRYSDDFMVVIPNTAPVDFRKHYETICGFITEAGGIEIKAEKTRIFSVENGVIRNCIADIILGQENGKNLIDFLGFSFDGKKIRLREKTISKYYNRMHRKAVTIFKCSGVTKKGNRINANELYKKYSYKGSAAYQNRKAAINGGKHIEGNLFDYLKASKRIIGDNFVDSITPRHMARIRRFINGKQGKHHK